MFEHLDDPTPPTFGAHELDQVARRRDARRRRAGLVGVTAVGVLAVVVGGLLVALARGDSSSGLVVTSQPDDGGAPTVPSTPSEENRASPDNTSTPDETVVLESTTSAASPTTDGTPVSASGETEFPLLADRANALSRDEWLVPLDPPAGYRESGGSVEVWPWYGLDGAPSVDPADQVEVRTFSLTGPGGLPRIEIEIADAPLSIGTVDGVTPVDDEIGGVPWFVGSGPLLRGEAGSQHVAQRSVGSTAVTVTGRGDLDEEDFREMVASLAVVPRSTLYSPILDPYGPGAREIFAEVAFGEPVRYRIESFDYDIATGQRGGEWQCSYLLQETSRFSDCGPPNEAMITGTQLHDAHQPPGEARLEVVAYGLTDPVVVRVEVAMFNGDVVETETKPTIGGGDQRYWFFADVFDFDPALIVPDQPLFLPPTIGSITAFDVDGNVVAVEQPPTALDEPDGQP